MLARRAFLIFANNMVGAAFGLVALLAIGRWMGPEAYGMFGFSLGLAGLAVFGARLGLDNAHIKRVSEGQDLAACIGTYLRARAVLTLTFLLAGWTALWAWDTSVGFTDATTLPVALGAWAITWLTDVRNIVTQTFQAKRMAASTETAVLAEHLLKGPLLIAGAVMAGWAAGRWIPGFGRNPDPMRWSTEQMALWIVGAHAAALVISLVVALVLFRRAGFPIGPWSTEMLRSYGRFAAPGMAVTALGVINQQVDKVMIGFFWDAAAVGQYFAAQRFMSLALIVPIAVRSLFFPMISEIAAEGRREAAHEIGITTQRLVTMVMMFFAAVAIAIPEQILHVFIGDAFLPAAPIVQVLGLLGVLQGLAMVNTATVGGFDRPVWGAILGGVIVPLNIALNLILIPSSIGGIELAGLGAVGAAWATLLSRIVHVGTTTIFVRRLVGRWVLTTAVLKHAMAAGLTAIALIVTKDPWFGAMDRIWELAAGLAFAGLIYLLSLIVMRDVGRKDWLYAVDLVHPGQMIRYVRDELRGRQDRE